jgi:type IV pilus assembly protein PilC
MVSVTTWFFEPGGEGMRSFLYGLKSSSVLNYNKRSSYSFTALLANAIESGIPIIIALDLIIKQCRDKKLEVVLQEVCDDLRIGFPFSEALAKHPYFFSTTYVSMVDSAEQSGNLSQVLYKLADHIEGDIKIRREAISKIYPLIIVGAVAGLIVYLFFIVIPRFFELSN